MRSSHVKRSDPHNTPQHTLMSVSIAKVASSLQQLSQEASELYLDSTVPTLDHVLSPLEFYRDWVAPNKPVKIRGAIDHWHALKKWTPEYLRDAVGEKPVTVAVTPNGYADAVNKDRFVMPEERVMPFGRFLDILENREGQNGVFYVQKQNSNFTDEFVDLLKDTEEEIPWASEALGKKPDAVNFWIGDERAVTSTHRDHYENIYCVVQGEKHFILYPPTDLPFVPYEMYQAAKYNENESGTFDIIDDVETGMVPWIPVDPLNPDLEKYPTFLQTHPVHVTVRAGETLYLPSIWFHHVRQSHGCIAVNYWYDMEFDIKYNYYKFVESLSKLTKESWSEDSYG